MSEYEGAVRRVIRVHLTSAALRRQVDSVDICQSVMMRFYVSLGLGQFEIDSPEGLVKLLAAMAKNRIHEIARREHAARRDIRRVAASDVGELPVAYDDPTPSELVCNRDLLDTVRQKLPERERYLADQRLRNRSWVDIGNEMQQPPDTLRISFTRAIERVIRQLGFE